MVNENFRPGTPEWEESKRWYRHQASKIFTGGIMAKFAFEELKAMKNREERERDATRREAEEK